MIFGKGGYKRFENKEEQYSLEIPNSWQLVSVTQDYGHSFSDGERKEGMLSVKPSVTPGATLEDYNEELVKVLQDKMKYEFLATIDAKVSGKSAKESTFLAPAYVNGKKENAMLVMCVIENQDRYRFVVMTYSVLEKEHEKHAGIYKHAKESFRIT